MTKKFKLLWWVFSVQYKLSPVLFCWKFLYAVYDGISSIVYVFVSAKIVSSISAVALANGPTSSVYRWLGLLLGLEVLIKIMTATNRLLVTKVNNQVQNKFNEDLMSKMYELSQEQFEDEAFNTKMSRAQDGLYSAERTLFEITWMLSSAVRMVSSYVAISAVSPYFGIVIIAFSIPALIFNLRLNRYTERVYRDNEPLERSAYRSRWLLIDPSFMPEIRLVNGFKQLVSKWRADKEKLDDAYFIMEKKSSIGRASIDLINPVIEVGAVVIFFQALVQKTISLDKFLFLRSLIDQFMGSVEAMSSSFQGLDQRFIELDNLYEVIRSKTSVPNGAITIKMPITIEFKNVSFRYPTAEKDTLKNISFLIVPGSKLALVGENGAGKSTLLKLVLRQYLPTKGQILVNGTDIKDVEQESYYAALSNLSQSFLMVTHFSVRENVSLGANNVDDKAINHALRLVEADTFVADLKHGLETRLDTSFEGGTDLSGGQRQRLGIARALLRSGDIMILDEPTSAIDAKAEFSIFNNIYKEHAGRTTLIVSHRFSTVRKAEGIIVMEDGRITEYGSHEELLKHGGLYKEMFELQAEGYK